MLRWRTSRRVAEVVWLANELRQVIEKEAEEFAPNETGGMLVGYANGRSLVITRLIPGGPTAVRSRARFQPDGKWQQAQLESIYVASGRIETYVGDWHSHPLGAGRPSLRDRLTAARVARAREARCRMPLTLIAGKTSTGAWDLAPFLYTGWRGFSLLPLESYDVTHAESGPTDG